MLSCKKVSSYFLKIIHSWYSNEKTIHYYVLIEEYDNKDIRTPPKLFSKN